MVMRKEHYCLVAADEPEDHKMRKEVNREMMRLKKIQKLKSINSSEPKADRAPQTPGFTQTCRAPDTVITVDARHLWSLGRISPVTAPWIFLIVLSNSSLFCGRQEEDSAAHSASFVGVPSQSAGSGCPGSSMWPDTLSHRGSTSSSPGSSTSMASGSGNPSTSVVSMFSK